MARPDIKPRTSDSRVRCLTNCPMQPGHSFKRSPVFTTLFYLVTNYCDNAAVLTLLHSESTECTVLAFLNAIRLRGSFKHILLPDCHSKGVGLQVLITFIKLQPFPYNNGTIVCIRGCQVLYATPKTPLDRLDPMKLLQSENVNQTFSFNNQNYV